jgi:hypothetical protein
MSVVSVLQSRTTEASKTMARRFVLTVGAIVLFALVRNGIVHGLALQEAEAAIAGLIRPAADRSLPLALLLAAGVGVMFVVSHAWLVRPYGFGQGLVHGAWFGVLAGLLVDLNQYLLYPIPGFLLGSLLTGIASALLGYCTVRGLWRLNLVSSHRRRKPMHAIRESSAGVDGPR